jgi:hypothetical protein
MSPYAEELAHARLEALRQLIDAMREAEDPAEKRRCAVAIFNAPDPCDLDDEIELEDEEDAEDADQTEDDLDEDEDSEEEADSESAEGTSDSPTALDAHADDLEDEPSDTFVDDDPDDPRIGLTPEQIIAKGAAILNALQSSGHSP